MTKISVFKPHLGPEEIQASKEALELGWLGPGSYVKDFENGIANLLGIAPKKVVAVNTGTSAVHLALKVCGVGQGDEVITPSFNNIADFQSIKYLGAEPVFCDVLESNLTIAPSKIEKLITKKTKAIITIDYGAALCDYEAVKKIADQYNIPVIHDAAHSFGSALNGKMVGAYSDICVFSFDPVKNITTIDGGAIIVHCPEQAKELRYMRQLGQKQSQDKLYQNSRSFTYDVESMGYRYHLANLHAAIGIEQLKKIAYFKQRRQDIFQYYNENLNGLGLILPPDITNNIFPFIYVVRIPKNRTKFREKLSEHGIDTGIHWQPGHNFSYFSNCKKGDLSVTEKISDQILTLPMYPDLTNDELQTIINSIKKVLLSL